MLLLTKLDYNKALFELFLFCFLFVFLLFQTCLPLSLNVFYFPIYTKDKQFTLQHVTSWS